jgi:hypothetical protein
VYFGKDPAWVSFYFASPMGETLITSKFIKTFNVRQSKALGMAIVQAKACGDLPREGGGEPDYDDPTVDEMTDHYDFEAEQIGDRQDWERRNAE